MLWQQSLKWVRNSAPAIKWQNCHTYAGRNLSAQMPRHPVRIPCLLKILKQHCRAVTSPKKQVKRTQDTILVRFVHFLGEVTAQQFCFEIYWPLVIVASFWLVEKRIYAMKVLNSAKSITNYQGGPLTLRLNWARRIYTRKTCFFSATRFFS